MAHTAPASADSGPMAPWRLTMLDVLRALDLRDVESVSFRASDRGDGLEVAVVWKGVGAVATLGPSLRKDFPPAAGEVLNEQLRSLALKAARARDPRPAR